LKFPRPRPSLFIIFVLEAPPESSLGLRLSQSSLGLEDYVSAMKPSD